MVSYWGGKDLKRQLHAKLRELLWRIKLTVGLINALENAVIGFMPNWKKLYFSSHLEIQIFIFPCFLVLNDVNRVLDSYKLTKPRAVAVLKDWIVWTDSSPNKTEKINGWNYSYIRAGMIEIHVWELKWMNYNEPKTNQRQRWNGIVTLFTHALLRKSTP